MLENHKRLLLKGCREIFGHHTRIDNIEVICKGGRTNCNILVLAAIVPKWLLKSIAEQVSPYKTTIILPWVAIEDLVTFLTFLHEFEPKLTENELVQLECAVNNLRHVFSVADLFSQRESFASESSEVIEVDFEDLEKDDYEHEVFAEDVTFNGNAGSSNCLSDLDAWSLSDSIIANNFSDQEGRLVCLSNNIN